MMLIKKILVCFLAGAGAGIGTGFAGMSAAAIIGPLLTTFLGMLGTLAVIRSKEGAVSKCKFSGNSLYRKF